MFNGTTNENRVAMGPEESKIFLMSDVGMINFNSIGSSNYSDISVQLGKENLD